MDVTQHGGGGLVTKPITIVAHRRYGKTDCVVEVTYRPNPKRKAEFDRMMAAFLLRHLVQDEDPAF